MTDPPETETTENGSRSFDDAFSSPPPPDVDCSLRIVKHAIPFSMLDPDAVKALRRINRFGHKAYLVGGCVRDILLGRQPKDFDVVTSAMPAEMRRMFRNCRLIGRRFRLAHLHFKNRKIIEVATFRRSPTEEDDMTIRHAAENLFGGPADDAIRRDFTINALMYDVGAKEIHDWVHGLQDIERRLLRTIGDPNRRISEDPVRILRAVKFGVHLDLTIDPGLMEAMRTHAPLITECAPARLVEEIFKLLRSGSSTRCLNLIHDIGVLDQLMPAFGSFVTASADDRPVWATLERADSMVRHGRAVSDSVLLAALLFEACREVLEAGGDVAKNLDNVLEPLVQPMPFTRRHMTRVRQIFMAQRRLAQGPGTLRARKILDREYAAEAIDLMELTFREDRHGQYVDSWRKALTSRYGTGTFEAPSKPRRRRRRRPPTRPTDNEQS